MSGERVEVSLQGDTTPSEGRQIVPIVYNTIRVHPEIDPYSEVAPHRRFMNPDADPLDETRKQDLLMLALLGTVLAFRDLELEQPFIVQGAQSKSNSRGIVVTSVPHKVCTQVTACEYFRSKVHP